MVSIKTILTVTVTAFVCAISSQVYIFNTPAIAEIRAEQKKDQDDIKYIREKVDKIYDEVRKESK